MTLIGNLGKDPDVKALNGNVGVAKFSLATSETYRDKSGQPYTSTDWHSVGGRQRHARAGRGAAAPTPHEGLLSRYCQLIDLKRYSPATLKSYRGTFQLFLAHHAPRLPLELTKHDVLDSWPGAWQPVFPKPTRIRSSTPSNSVMSRWEGPPR